MEKRREGRYNDDVTDYEKEIYRLLDENSPREVFFIPYTDPFRFLVTVILSCASNDRAAVISAGKLFSAYPGEKDIVSAPDDEVERLIFSSGLARRKCRTIKAAAGYFVRNRRPQSRADVLSIPGVGEKTASCYMQHVFSAPSVTVDIHFERVSYRLGFSSSHDRIRTMHEIMELFDSSLWNRLSDTVNLLGRTFCRPKAKCGECFLKESCRKRGVC